jgi:hypothetical protein
MWIKNALFRKNEPPPKKSSIDRYEIKACYRIEGEPTGNFIVVDLSYWMYHSNYYVKVLVREEESDNLPNFLMRKVKKNHNYFYRGHNEEYELGRIRSELDKVLPKPSQ